MDTATQAGDESAQQSIHDRSVIDHLVATFHSETRDEKPEAVRAEAVYDLIRREWPATLGAQL
jgi:hypothetical protein